MGQKNGRFGSPVEGYNARPMDEEFDLKVELDLPQPDIRDEEKLKAFAFWQTTFHDEHGRYPDEDEMRNWTEEHKPRT